MFVRNLADELVSLLEAPSIDTLWERAVSLIETAGYAALTIVELSPDEGPFWAKSSASDRWLFAYATDGFHAFDPVMQGGMTGQREIRVQLGDDSLDAVAPEKAARYRTALADAGYGQFDAMVFNRPDRATRTLVVLVSEAATDDRTIPGLKTSRQLLMSTLAAALHRLGPADDGGFL